MDALGGQHALTRFLTAGAEEDKWGVARFVQCDRFEPSVYAGAAEDIDHIGAHRGIHANDEVTCKKERDGPEHTPGADNEPP
jgi:hypothetical protein